MVRIWLQKRNGDIVGEYDPHNSDCIPRINDTLILKGSDPNKRDKYKVVDVERYISFYGEHDIGDESSIYVIVSKSNER